MCLQVLITELMKQRIFLGKIVHYRCNVAKFYKLPLFGTIAEFPFGGIISEFSSSSMCMSAVLTISGLIMIVFYVLIRF